MEECKQQIFSVEQGEDTLLSYKMLKMSNYPTAKTLIDSIKPKNNSQLPSLLNSNRFLFPIMTLTTSVDLNVLKEDPDTAKTLKFRKSDTIKKVDGVRRDSKQTISKSSKRDKSKTKEKDFRFLKLLKGDNRNDGMLFEQSVLSIKDITGVGYIVLRGGRILEGEFVQGVPIGPIRIKYENGIVYKGPVYNYRPHGMGEMNMQTGQRFVGQFCYGQPHGEGIHYFADGGVRREGEWRHGKFVK